MSHLDGKEPPVGICEHLPDCFCGRHRTAEALRRARNLERCEGSNQLRGVWVDEGLRKCHRPGSAVEAIAVRNPKLSVPVRQRLLQVATRHRESIRLGPELAGEFFCGRRSDKGRRVVAEQSLSPLAGLVPLIVSRELLAFEHGLGW